MKKKQKKPLYYINKVKDRFKDLIGKNFNVEAIHNGKYTSTKLKSFKDEIRINYHGDGLPPEKTPCAAISIILTGSVCRSDK